MASKLSFSIPTQVLPLSYYVNFLIIWSRLIFFMETDAKNCRVTSLYTNICYYLCLSTGKTMFMVFCPSAEGSGLKKPNLQWDFRWKSHLENSEVTTGIHTLERMNKTSQTTQTPQTGKRKTLWCLLIATALKTASSKNNLHNWLGITSADK